jgi:hypothetical protein
MTQHLSVYGCVLLLAGAVCSTLPQRGADTTSKPEFVGTWTGTWDGGGGAGGGIELTLEQAKDGPLTGKVAVTGEPTYKAVFRSVSFDGKKMTAKYDFPPDDAIGVVLAGSFDGDTATGIWSARDKASDAEVATGTWKVTKKL